MKKKIALKMKYMINPVKHARLARQIVPSAEISVSVSAVVIAFTLMEALHARFAKQPNVKHVVRVSAPCAWMDIQCLKMIA